MKVFSVHHESSSRYGSLLCNRYDDLSSLVRGVSVEKVKMRTVPGQDTIFGLGDCAMCDSLPVFRHGTLIHQTLEMLSHEYYFEFAPVRVGRDNWSAMLITRFIDVSLSPKAGWGARDLYGSMIIGPGLFRISSVPQLFALLATHDDADPLFSALSSCPELRMELVPYHFS